MITFRQKSYSQIIFSFNYKIYLALTAQIFLCPVIELHIHSSGKTSLIWKRHFESLTFHLRDNIFTTNWATDKCLVSRSQRVTKKSWSQYTKEKQLTLLGLKLNYLLQILAMKIHGEDLLFILYGYFFHFFTKSCFLSESCQFFALKILGYTGITWMKCCISIL